MSLANANNRNDYTGNDTTATYGYTFRVFLNSDFVVTVRNTTTGVETTLTLTTDYTVTGVLSASGGNIVLVDAAQDWISASSFLDTGYKITIRRIVTLDQGTDIRNQGDFYPEVHEDFFDKAIMIDQQQQEDITRSMKLPETVTSSDFDAALPTDIATANATLIVNPAGTGIIVGPTAADISGAQANAVAAAASAAAALVSETAAAVSASASQWQDVSYLTFSDSPITIADASSGVLHVIDTSGGAVAVTLPEISALTLTSVWAAGFKKSTTDANAITITRGGSDTVDGATSVTITRAQAGKNLIPDADGTPDNWTSLSFGEVPIAGAIVGTTDAQVLTAKTFDDEVVHQEISTPSTPAAGYQSLYFDSTSKELTRLNEAGVAIPIGSGAGSGSGGYFADINSNLNNNVITDFETFDDSSSYVNGTGGSTTGYTVAATAVGGELLEGNYSLKIAKAPSTDASGWGVSLVTSTIEPKDLGRELHGSMEIDFTDANYTADDYEMYAYDVTNSAILPLSIIGQDDNKLSNKQGRVQYSVQTIATTASVRISLYMDSDSDTTNAIDLFVDDFKIDVDAPIPGSIATDWEDFTPTGSWTTNTTYTGQWRRVGDSMEIMYGVVTGGTPTSATFTVDMPSGYTVDESKLPSGPTNPTLGSALIAETGVQNFGGIVRYETSTNLISVLYDNGSALASVTQAAPFAFLATDTITFNVTLPITGWKASNLISSTANLFSTAATRHNTGGAGQTITNATTSVVDFGTQTFDDLGLVTTGAAWKFTAAKSGKYAVHAAVRYGNSLAWSSGSYVGIHLYKNGSSYSSNDTLIQAAVTPAQGPSAQITDTIDLVKGDYIDIRTAHGEAASRALVVAGTLNFVDIKAIPDFSVFGMYGETDTVELQGEPFTYPTWTAGGWLDIGSFELFTGTWEVLVIVMHRLGSAAVPGFANDIFTHIHTASGNNEGTRVYGQNTGVAPYGNYIMQNLTTSFISEITVAADTTYYLKQMTAAIPAASSLRLDYYKVFARRI